jgi:hypothetical protein
MRGEPWDVSECGNAKTSQTERRTRRAIAIALLITGVWSVGHSAEVTAKPFSGTSHATLSTPEGMNPEADAPEEPMRRVDPGELDACMARATAYLVDACGPDGKFKYRINTDPKVIVEPKYNMLRHAGAMYALASYARHTDNPPALEALGRARHFLVENAVKPVDGDDTMLAVWTVPELTGQDYPAPVAKLGGAGLALIALTCLEEVQPGATSRDTLAAFARFICFMQKSDGSFYSKYIPHEGGRSDAWVSLYYPGEAILGLLSLYERDPKPEWLEAATRGMTYLATSRIGVWDTPPDHWALIATDKLLSNLSESDVSQYGQVFIRHAEQICFDMLRSRCAFPPGDPAYGCFDPEGATCSTATRLEGTLAVVPHLPPKTTGLREAILTTSQESIGFLMSSQIKTGPYTGGIPRAVIPRQPDRTVFDESLLLRAGEIRIDYVQHALSAMLLYRQVLENEGSEKSQTR